MSKMQTSSASFWRKLGLLITVTVLYIVSFPAFYTFAGPVSVAFAVVVTVLAGWLYGVWVGLLAGGLSFPMNFLLFTWVGEDAASSMLTGGGIPGTIVIVGMSVFAGILGDLNKKMQKNLAASNKLASFAEASPNAVVEIDSRRVVTYANPEALSRFPDIKKKGLEHYALRGLQSVIKGLALDQEAIVPKQYNRTLSFDKHDYDQRIIGLPGESLLRVYFTDITKIREAERTLRQQADEVQKMNDLMIGREIKMVEMKKKLIAQNEPNNEIIQVNNLAKEESRQENAES